MNKSGRSGRSGSKIEKYVVSSIVEVAFVRTTSHIYSYGILFGRSV
jgi:hypothetical protein